LREIHTRVVGPAWRIQPPDDLLPGETPGRFRQHNIKPFPGGMTPPDFTDVPPQISDWLRLGNSEPEPGQPLIEHLARVHAGFERIHTVPRRQRAHGPARAEPSPRSPRPRSGHHL
jgi:hypothetical protein